ncbi:hypothetical protein QUB68_11640 [Microcoleus sp. A006_D1]
MLDFFTYCIEMRSFWAIALTNKTKCDRPDLCQTPLEVAITALTCYR